MLFDLEFDTGDTISLYLLSDAFSAVSSIRVSGGSEVLLTMSANEMRESMVTAGRHESGMCGFRIDASMIPGMSGYDDLEIHDEETGLLLYRRPWGNYVQKKVLNLNSLIFPNRTFESYLSRTFQYHATRLELYGAETVLQIFHLDKYPSMFLSGRVLYKNYAYLADTKFETVFCIDDPYELMAERIVLFAKLHELGNAELMLGRRDAYVFGPAIEFSSSLAVNDGKALRRAFRAMPSDVAQAFVDPTTRLLTASTPDELARTTAVAGALDALAGFAVVGLRKEVGSFVEAVAGLLEIDANRVPVPSNFPMVKELAKRLREEARVEELIDKDLELYERVLEVYDRTAEEPAPAEIEPPTP
jgi:hypothetical protein